ncbi:hypothetical protein ABZY09_36240 [Streptomyces sp. NPDC002928]|uniref:hypothetical protein n=1 Tax=Streptomyces sp. NPDC002928 TaxID=3154440 RepID=UPI0033A296CE
MQGSDTVMWWAAEARLGWWGPDGNVRLVVATADPATLPAKATWYLATDLPRPGSPRAAESPYPPAALAEIVRIYGHLVDKTCDRFVANPYLAVRPPLRTSLHAQQRPAPQKCHRALPTPTCEQHGYNPRGPSRVRNAAMR